MRLTPIDAEDRHDGPYPHYAGCHGCLINDACTECAAPISRLPHCSNGRCEDCHFRVCGPSLGLTWYGVDEHPTTKGPV